MEPTVNRVGDRYFDQMERNGHAGPRGEADLERFAALGLRALRYPVLWERHAPDGPTVRDWTWTDRRLGRLRELGMRPIVGLIHHGSGPRRTHLLDPHFADGLADYARQVAERFPWVEEWTPVNEPLTTARFAALYGHWYPHARDDRSFVRALLHQCRAVVLAMRAVRRVRPSARLVQTEDLGRTHSTRPMAAQANFENARRWLTWDLLAGRVDPAHDLWGYLRGPGGADEAELRWFVENPCPPDVLGVNTYVTSERFLDHRPGRYPAYAKAGDAQRPHADVVAVRASQGGAAGPGRLLREAWARYGLPVAITEAHLGCTREEQCRWALEVWRDARALREGEGADVRAVTLWSLLGSYDWCHLLTRAAGDYEPGVFDLRVPPGQPPRSTALARLARELATHGDSVHPALAVPGWWRRPTRFDHPPARACQPLGPILRGRGKALRQFPSAPAPLLLTGADGTLGRAFVRACEQRALPYAAFLHGELDTADMSAVNRALDRCRPWAVIDTVGGTAPETLARACAARGDRPLLAFSSDRVFGGENDEPRDEAALPAPRDAFGRAQVQAENRVRTLLPDRSLIVRTAALFGPTGDEDGFLPRALRAWDAGEPWLVAAGGLVTPTYVPDLVHACLDLLLDGETGFWHLVSASPALSWTQWVEQATLAAGMPAARARAGWAEGKNVQVPPGGCALVSRRAYGLLPARTAALERFLGEWRQAADRERERRVPVAA